MPRSIVHVEPDYRLSKAERDADRAAWDALEAENRRLRAAINEALRAASANGMAGWPLFKKLQKEVSASQ